MSSKFLDGIKELHQNNNNINYIYNYIICIYIYIYIAIANVITTRTMPIVPKIT